MKNTNLTPLNNYEHDAMWMSYRYAIGRHTAASTMHAGYMIQNIYGRISEEQLEFDIFDIRREINRVLEWNFNFGLDLNVPCEYYDPFKALIEFSKLQGPKNEGLLNYLKNHKVIVYIDQDHNYQCKISDPVYPGQEKYEAHLRDLICWANMTNALDKKKHHMVTTKYSGEEKTYEAFESITYSEFNGFVVSYTAIDAYLENPFKYSYISEEFITKVDGKNFVFGKDKVIGN